MDNKSAKLKFHIKYIITSRNRRVAEQVADRLYSFKKRLLLIKIFENKGYQDVGVIFSYFIALDGFTCT